MHKPPYKASNGAWYTSSLFWELWSETQIPNRRCDPVFSLYSQRPGLVCFRTTFVELGDVTGYKWAQMYLGDWEHWLKLYKSPWFRKAYEHAKEELYIKLRTEGLDKIREMATSTDAKASLPAAKYLAELERNLEKRQAGRPSAAEVSAELKNAQKAMEVEDEDAERIGLTLIKGGKSG